MYIVHILYLLVTKLYENYKLLHCQGNSYDKHLQAITMYVQYLGSETVVI